MSLAICLLTGIDNSFESIISGFGLTRNSNLDIAPLRCGVHRDAEYFFIKRSLLGALGVSAVK
jgi:hypothetical protein